MKRGCQPLCDVADGTEMWVPVSFHNFFKTSQLFTEIVLNNAEKKYIDNQPLIDEIFKQLLEKSTFNINEMASKDFLYELNNIQCKLSE